jgi:L-serine dehydratase
MNKRKARLAVDRSKIPEERGLYKMEMRADHISPLDMFKIGVGPSSSHTVGPMVAALEFRKKVIASGAAVAGARLTVELFGSLSATGRGHATDGAVCAGLSGLHPRTAMPGDVWAVMPFLESNPQLDVEGVKLAFSPPEDITWSGWSLDDKPLPHPNTLRFRILKGSDIAFEQITVSVGGGFIEQVDPVSLKRIQSAKQTERVDLPYPYNTAQEFVQQCRRSGLAPWELVTDNEMARGLEPAALRAQLKEILATMESSIERGLSTDGILPGGLNVRRRAKELYQQMQAGKQPGWAGNDLRPSIYAMAVNEENAAGGKVVTAPTNGSSGIIPSVWRTLKESSNLDEETMVNGLIVASVIGALVKTHASISGAEVGCQGEVGTSCAMAAAGAVSMLGGSVDQLEQAAEIGIEHHLGMTCDPIQGLVQIPCIERNAMGAVKALNAAALSLASDGSHLISLDRALEVMKQTGLDMNQKYKETATGGLALG